jgi:hypothetical protein
MLEERLVAQEARKLQVVTSDAQVQQEMQKIAKEIYGGWEKFQAKLQEDGVSQGDLQNHVRNIFIYKAVKAAKALPGSDPEVSFNTWLIQAKQKAELAIYYSGDGTSTSSALRGGCCGLNAPSGAGGCGGQSVTPRRLDPKAESQAQKAALEAFQKNNPAAKGLTAKVTDYGCHIQVDIQKEGKIVKSYSYQGGKAFEIS